MDRRAPGAAAVGGHVFTAGGGGVLRRVPYTLGRSTRRRVLRLADGLTEVVPSSAITSTLAGGDGCYFAAPPPFSGCVQGGWRGGVSKVADVWPPGVSIPGRSAPRRPSRCQRCSAAARGTRPGWRSQR